VARVARFAIRLFLTACFIGLSWGGWYLSTKGLGRGFRQFINSEFHKRGAEVSIGRLTLDPFQGLIARDVQVMDERDRSRTLAVVNRIILDINYPNLVRREPFLDAVDLLNAKLDLPLDPSRKSGPRVRILVLNAHVQFPPHAIYLPHAEADVYGLHITASGRLVNPELFHPSRGGKERAKTRGIETLLDELRRLRFPSGPARLDVRVTGDLAHPEGQFAEATFQAREVEREGYRLRNVYAAATLRDGVIDLKRCAAADNTGALDAGALYDVAARAVRFQVHSTLDLRAMARPVRRWLERNGITLRAPPDIQLSGSAHFAETLELNASGRAGLGKFSVKSVPFQGLGARFSVDGARWFIRNLRADAASGGLAADAIQLPGDFRLRLHSTLNPKVLLPLLPRKAVETLGDWDFAQAPDADWEVRGASAGEPGDWDAQGQVRLRRTVLRGVAMNSAVSKVRFKEGAFTCQDFRVDRDEGSATGTFSYDFRRHEARLSGIKSALNPGEALAWIDPGLVKHVTPYRFHTRPNLSVNGTVGDKGTNLEILLDAPGGMSYTFLGKNLPASGISGRLLFTDDRLRIFGLDAALFGGHLQGGADISLARNSKAYSAHLTALAIDFEKLTKLYFDYDGSKGVLDGQYEFTGVGDNTRAMQGRGAITVSEGNVFAIPVLGPLSGLLNSLVPGMGYNVARKASCSYEVRDGTVETRNFVVDGRGFSMIGAGKIDFEDDKMDFNIRLNAKGIPGTLLFPVSKLFEYSSTGTMARPSWHLKRLPSLPPPKETP